MNKEKKLALSGAEGIVPKLRFPEFESDGEWKEKRLDEVAEIVTGSTPKTSETENYGGSKLFVSPADISNKRYIDSTIKTLTGLGLSKSRIIPENCVLFVCIGSTIGKIAQNKIECATNQQINSLIPFGDNNNNFIYSLLENNSRYIASLSAQQAVPLINKSEFSAIKLHFPKNPKEQQKIANCLSSLDEVITAENEKLDLLKDHKKGLLQQLFPNSLNHDSKRLKDDLDFQNSKKSSHQANPKNQGADNVPRFRFPEFKNDGDWEAKLIKEACNKPFSGGTPKSNNSNYYGGDIPFIRSAEINKETTELFLTEEGFQNSSAKMVKRGDVLIAMYGANSGDVAISKIDGAINQAILCLRSRTHNPFLFQYLIFKKDFINNTYLQGGQGNLSGDIIKSIELLFPQNPREQERIANCLSAADELIEAQAQKITQLQEHKKGLLQQLFPTIND